MGCIGSTDIFNHDQQLSCIKNGTTQSSNCNEFEIDRSHFISLNMIGIGGFGMVRSVQKLSGDDRLVEYAMKSMSKAEILKRASGPSSVMSELKALTLLNGCPFICNLRYAFQDKAHLFLILELATGGDMRCNLRKQPHFRFSELQIQFFASQIFLAIEYCHRSNILHRDIKPENILLTHNGYLKLTDFGVAKILDDIEDCRSTSGTHGYMAPEIYCSGHLHGTASQWFAFGVTLHEFLTGRRPYELTKLQEFRNESIEDLDDSSNDDMKLVFDRQKCSHLSESCKDFIHRLLSINPTKRLGYKNNTLLIQQHPWIQGLNWQLIVTQMIPSPIQPPSEVCQLDLNSSEMQNAIKRHLTPKYIDEKDQAVFQEYGYRHLIKYSDFERTASSEDHHKSSCSDTTYSEDITQIPKSVIPYYPQYFDVTNNRAGSNKIALTGSFDQFIKPTKLMQIFYSHKSEEKCHTELKNDSSSSSKELKVTSSRLKNEGNGSTPGHFILKHHGSHNSLKDTVRYSSEQVKSSDKCLGFVKSKTSSETCHHMSHLNKYNNQRDTKSKNKSKVTTSDEQKGKKHHSARSLNTNSNPDKNKKSITKVSDSKSEYFFSDFGFDGNLSALISNIIPQNPIGSTVDELPLTNKYRRRESLLMSVKDLVTRKKQIVRTIL